jgi:plasmid replication initiation protein
MLLLLCMHREEGMVDSLPAPPPREKGSGPTALVTGKDEMNLAEFPFALLAKRAGEGRKTIEVIQEGRDADGRPVRQEWLVTGSDRFGLPLAADDEVYVALMKLLRDNQFAERTVRFTVAQLLRVMHSTTSKRDYERVAASLDRLSGVLIRSKNAFWDHAHRRYVTEAFHLLDSYRLAHGGSGRELSEVTFSEFLFGSIQAGYVKNLDVEFYFSLSTPLTRRYYRLLDKHRYRGHVYEVELRRLAHKLPLHDEYESQLKRRLDPVHREFIERGFLAAADYRPGVGGETIVQLRFTHSQRNGIPNGRESKSPAAVAGAIADTTPARPPEGPDESDRAVLRERLQAAGVSRTIAAQIVRRHSDEAITQQLAYLPFVEDLKNPGGYLRLAIEHGYGPPPAWIRAERARQRSVSGSKPGRAASVSPGAPPNGEPESGPDKVEQNEWQQLNPSKQETLLAEAEAALRADNTAFRNMRRLPTPLVTAHARHLLAARDRSDV